MFAVLNNKKLFSGAHQLARQTRNNFGSYREAFAAALRRGYQIIAKVSDKCAAIVKAAIIKAAPKMQRNDKIANTLIKWGFRVWSKGDFRRIYVNMTRMDGGLNRRTVRCILQNDINECLKQRARDFDKIYYDLNDKSWHGLASWMALNEQIAA